MPIMKQERELKEDKEVFDEGQKDEKRNIVKDILEGDKKKIMIIVGAVILVATVVVLGSTFSKKKAPNNIVSQEENMEGINSVSENLDGTPVESAPMEKQYTESEKADLRAAGYTGDDIEQFSKDNVEAQQKIDEALADRQALIEKQYNELKEKARESGSEEYKELLDKTWLSGAPHEPTGSAEDLYNLKEITYNARYIKLPARGNQLFIRLTLDDGSYIFYNVTPTKYIQLKEEGNMVIIYNDIELNGEHYITDIREKDIE